jgi:hypothetical protein
MSESYALLKQFFETREVGKRAAAPLKRGAEAGLLLGDAAPGVEYRFTVENGRPEVLEGKAKDPDFILTLPAAAVKKLVAVQGEDPGDFGVAFFSQVLAKEPEERVKIKLHSGLITLTRRGYLGVLALGGPKVIVWLARKGLSGPRAVAHAISRLRHHGDGP